jgi:hypothetical protein
MSQRRIEDVLLEAATDPRVERGLREMDEHFLEGLDEVARKAIASRNSMQIHRAVIGTGDETASPASVAMAVAAVVHQRPTSSRT